MSNKRVKSLLYSFFVFSFLAWGCSKDDPVSTNDTSTPRTNVPQNLAKNWYYGNISSTNFFNTSTGQFSAPSGIGMYFKFTQDGYYEKGILLQTSLYGCTSTFFAFSKGTTVVEGNRITLYPTYGKIKSEDNCTSSNNYEKADNTEIEVMIWQTGTDEYNSEVLWLSYENSEPSAFHLQD